MAHTAPVFLALLINCFSIFVFRNLSPSTIGPFCVSTPRYMFTLATYFLLLDIKLYPERFRKVHWTVRSIVEFILAIYLFEMFLFDFWYPLETFIANRLIRFAYLLKKYGPNHGSLRPIMCMLFGMLTDRLTPILLKTIISTGLLLVILHGTKTINFSIIECGVKEFAEHVCIRFFKGLMRLKKSIPFLPQSRNVPARRCTC